MPPETGDVKQITLEFAALAPDISPALNDYFNNG
jgi:hypothetical protein